MVDEGRLVLKDGRWTPTGDLADLPVPPTISALLAARLDRLPRIRAPADRGRIGDGTGLLPRPPSGSSRTTVSDAIDAASPRWSASSSSAPSAPTCPATDALGFRHLLIRDAAYGSIPKATRAELHERFAEWLDETAGSLGERDEIVGYHLEQAYRYRAELGPTRRADAGARRPSGRAARRRGPQAYGTPGRLGHGEPPGASGRAALPRGSAPARAPRGPGAGAVAVRTSHARMACSPRRSKGRGPLGDRRLEALAGVRRLFVRMMLDPETMQHASLEEAERYAELFDGWSDDLGVAEALTLVGTIRFWAGRCAVAEEVSSARTSMRAGPGADRRRARSPDC